MTLVQSEVDVMVCVRVHVFQVMSPPWRPHIHGVGLTADQFFHQCADEMHVERAVCVTHVGVKAACG